MFARLKDVDKSNIIDILSLRRWYYGSNIPIPKSSPSISIRASILF